MSRQQYPTPTDTSGFVECLNRHHAQAFGTASSLLGARSHFSVEHDGDHAAFIVVQVGWEVERAALLDFRSSVPVTYDTNALETLNGSGVIGRALPNWVTATFGACGAEHRGSLTITLDAWLDEMEGRPPGRLADHPPSPPFYVQEPVEDLLPPL